MTLLTGALVAAVAVAVGAEGLAPGEQFTRPLGMQLVRTTIVEAQQRLGAAPVVESGHHEQTVCYFDSRSRTYVAFTAQDEGLSGGFTARRLEGETPPGCARLPASALKALERGIGGLRLGMSRQQFLAVVGTRVSVADGFETATFERSDPLFISVVVRARFAHGRLAEYVILKTATT